MTRNKLKVVYQHTRSSNETIPVKLKGKSCPTPAVKRQER